MATFRCMTCDINWPRAEFYQPCAGCGRRAATDYMGEPMAEDAAISLKSHIEFERYWQEWDLRQFRGQLADL
jgi:hypothetical protein